MTVRKNYILGTQKVKHLSVAHHTITITHINTVSDPQQWKSRTT